jgi:hypothetical protein
MLDPNGNEHIHHTPLASWIGDLPEQRTISCVLANQSAILTASLEAFGDGVVHPWCTHKYTLDNIQRACSKADPTHLLAFLKACVPLGLNGVHQPFWRNWGNADLSIFLTPDALHAWHKFFFNHPLKWIINIMGSKELDHRMAALQQHVGMCHWAHGISKLKQVTGCKHRDLEKILVVVAAGGVPNTVLSVICTLVEFIFQVQGLLIYDEQLHPLHEALHKFHVLKNSIISAGRQCGKNGPIYHFNIPKLEGMSGVAKSIAMMGAPYQHTMDITERCHITHVKTPYHMSNGHM